MGLGALHAVSLAEARNKATECRKQLSEGVDPLRIRKEQRQQEKLAAARGVTFKQCAEFYIAAHEASWKNKKHKWQWDNSLSRFVYPVFGNLPVQDIDIALVMKVIEPLWKDKTETASRVRGRIETVLGWATVRGYREGDNPARWRGRLDNLLPPRSKVQKVEHHSALPYAEIGEFMEALAAQEGLAAQALTLTILTATRTSEALNAEWSEFDLKEKLWVIPAERIKSGREHRIPLSEPVLKILRQLEKAKTSKFVFPGKRDKPLSNMSMLMLLRRMGHDDLTVHGFRSSFRDWAAEQTNYPREVAEMALAHAISDKVEAAYRRGDLLEKRRQLMDAWARYCYQPPAKGVKGKVLKLRG